jgi:cysteinyl-tRNA synthetase
MGDLKLYNTLTRTKEVFAPRDDGRVKFFSCGPSVYRRQHLGNYRTYLFEDVLQKYLEYKGAAVERVINFTDVEDKAVTEARDKGIDLKELRGPVEEAFFQECDLLGIRLPDTIPRASTSIESATDLIARLIERGHAYRHGADIFFDPTTYPGFGRLYGLDMRRWPQKKVRFRRDTYPGQRWNLGDFILWHGRRDRRGEVWWDTPIGQGRPAWNLQDAAMIRKHLGDRIDLHAGGIDNLYRHHDYTLAIMESATGEPFCPFWVHGGHLLVRGIKMSKSRNNVTYVEDLLEQGFLPRHIRFFLLYGPYRDKLDLRLERLEQCVGRLDRLRRRAAALGGERNDPAAASRTGNSGAEPAAGLRAAFEARMDDNLDYAGAFDAVAEHLQRAIEADTAGRMSSESLPALRTAIEAVDRVLGVLEFSSDRQ